MQYPDNFGATYEEEFDSKSLKLEVAIKEADDNNFAVGAFSAGGKMVGICGFIAARGLKKQHRGEIVQLFVETKYANKGIGKKLLQQVIDKAFENKQIEQIALGVVDTNENAIRLYKQFGFTEYGRLEKYFKTAGQYTTQLFLCLMKENYRL
ncbi:hypothetical protein GCM10027043_05120 [Ferruginibacter profundus]